MKGYLTNSSGIGNYNTTGYSNQNSVAVTGSSDSYVIKNIYDLAGNVPEFTMETYDDGDYFNKIPRGGSCDNSGSDFPVSKRHYAGASTSGFRTALYL